MSAAAGPKERSTGLRAFQLVRRIAVIWLIQAATLHLLASVLPGLELRGWEGAFAAVAVIALLNALLWPLLVRFAIPVLIWTLGFASILLNAAVILLAGELIDEFHVADFGTALIIAIVLGAVNALLSALLAIDDDGSFHRRVTLQLARSTPNVEHDNTPGVFFLEIDGMSLETLRRAIRDGHAPTLERWIREGSHTLLGWECDLSSQTGASQAGLLHGDNSEMPAFRWYDKTEDRLVVSNNPRDAPKLEQAHSDGNGLLADGGASRGNLFSGDAPRSAMTLSTVLAGGRHRRDLYAFFADPYSFVRTLMLSVADIGLEISASFRQRRRDIRPRVDRGGIYPLLRAATTVLFRDLNVYVLIGDMMRGVPVTYSTFVGYDEVAHHSGVERADALAVLLRLDRQFARLEAAAAQAPRPYRLVVLSDHGQSQGATFKQRYGETLEEVVQQAISGRSVAGPAAVDEAWGHVSTAASEIAEADDGVVARATRRATRKRTHDGTVEIGPDEREQDSDVGAADVIVLASGNLGLAYSRSSKERLTLESMESRDPGLVATLAAHPGIGFLMIRSERSGPVAIGAQGTRVLETGVVDGIDPLAPFGPNAAQHLLRTDSFSNCPDVLINSFYDPGTEEVAAFEELVGSHGGLGGPQSHPFVLIPSDWERPGEPIVGAEHLHRLMKAWVAAETGGETAKGAAPEQ